MSPFCTSALAMLFHASVNAGFRRSADCRRPQRGVRTELSNEIYTHTRQDLELISSVRWPCRVAHAAAR